MMENVSRDVLLIGFGAFAAAFFASLMWMIFQKKREQHQSPCVSLQLLQQRVGEHVRWYENMITQIKDIHKNLEMMREELVKIRTQMELSRNDDKSKEKEKI